MSRAPFDDEAERMLLGAWLTDARFQSGWCPEPELFLARPHRMIAELLASRFGRDDYDVTALVLDARRDEKLLATVGGAGELEDLVVSAPLCRDPWATVERLRRYRAHSLLLRRLGDAMREANDGANLADTQTIVADALQAAMLGTGSQGVTLRPALQEAAIQANTPSRDDERIWTRVEDLDRGTAGHGERAVWVFGAFTNAGKSSWAAYIADQALQQGHRPLIISLEDELPLYARKFLQLRAKVNALRLRDHRLEQNERRRVLEVANAAPDVVALLDGRQLGCRAESIAGAIRSLCASDGIDFVLIDYVQKLDVEKKCDTRRDELAYASRLLTDAIKASAPMGGVLFSQLTGDKSQRPSSDQVRDCRDISHGAETIVLLYRNEQREPIAVVDKVKEGPTGYEIPLPWNKACACFEPSSTLPMQYSDYGDEGDAA